MKKDNKKLKDIFNNFKRNNHPFPAIELKINQQKKIIEKILTEMDKNLENLFINKNIQKIENKPKEKPIILKIGKINDKINFGPVTYLNYKESQDDITVCKYTFEFLRKKIVNSKNFTIGFYNFKNNKNFNNNINLTETRSINNRRKKNIKPKLLGIKTIKNKKVFRIRDKLTEKEKENNENNEKNENNENNEKNEIKEDLNNDNFQNNLETFPTNENDINSKTKVIRSFSNLNGNNDINHLSDKFINFFNRGSNSLTNRRNLTSYRKRKHFIFYKNKKNNNNDIKYNITDYLDKKMPIDSKEIKIRNKTLTDFNDNKDMLKFYKTTNNFFNGFSNKININNNKNNKTRSFSMMNELFYINNIAKNQKEKLRHIYKKKLDVKLVEKLLNKKSLSFNPKSIFAILNDGKHRKIKMNVDMKKIKTQMKHLFLVDKVGKYADNISSEKMENFNQEYNKKSEKIGISDNIITLNNGKIYHQSKSESKKLGKKIRENSDIIHRLRYTILTNKKEIEEKELMCKKLNEKMKKK